MSTKNEEEIVNKLFITEWGKTATDAPRERINPYLTKSEILDILTSLRKEQEEAYTKGYNAGLADGTGKPLLAIEQIREEAVARVRKEVEGLRKQVYFPDEYKNENPNFLKALETEQHKNDIWNLALDTLLDNMK